MIYVFKDGSGYQQFPAPSFNSTPYIEVTGDDEARILAGDSYLLNAVKDGILFPSAEAVEAEEAEAELASERARMIVSRFQARAALHGAGLLASAETAINNSGDDLAQMAWADAQEFRRNSPTVAAIAGALSLTDEQLDDLFRQAATIEA